MVAVKQSSEKFWSKYEILELVEIISDALFNSTLVPFPNRDILVAIFKKKFYLFLIASITTIMKQDQKMTKETNMQKKPDPWRI